MPGELQTLRDEIDQIDNRILDLLGQRKDIVSKVADVKRRHQLKVRDRTREATLLEDRRLRCQNLGLRKEVIESLYRVVLTASRDHQAALGTEVPMDLKRRTVAVIGGHGGMGQLFAKLFEDLGQDVLVADLDTTLTPVEAAQRAEVVLMSVPMDATPQLIKELGPHVNEDGLFSDLTSIKTTPIAAMCEHSKSDVIGLHPMFGPGVHTLQEQRVVFVPGRVREGSPWPEWLRTCLLARGFSLLESTAEDHDRAMAIVQVLTHFSTEVLGLAMARSGVPVQQTLEFASPVYLIELVMTARHFCQSAELYGEIHMANPNGKDIVRAFSESLQAWREAVETGDLVAFERLFEETHAFFGDHSKEAMEQSSYLIDRFIERR